MGRGEGYDRNNRRPLSSAVEIFKFLTENFDSFLRVVKIYGEATDPIEIWRGVRQGCIVSSILFNFYSEYVFREAINEVEEGISLYGIRLNNIRYADDTFEGFRILINTLNNKNQE